MRLPTAESTFEERLRAADEALRAGRAQTAEHWLRALTTEAPADLNCRWLLGVALLDRGKNAESIVTFEGVLRGAPEFKNARVDLARAYRSADRVAEARDQVRRVLERQPHHALAWLAYGDALPQDHRAGKSAKLDRHRRGRGAAAAAGGSARGLRAGGAIEAGGSAIAHVDRPCPQDPGPPRRERGRL